MRTTLLLLLGLLIWGCSDTPAEDAGAGDDVGVDAAPKADGFASDADADTDAPDVTAGDTALDASDGEVDRAPEVGDGFAPGDPDGAGADGAIADGTTEVVPAEDAAPAEDVAAAEDTGPTEPPPVFDLPMIQDASTADCTFTNHRTVLKDLVTLDVWDVTYTSFESIGGALGPITIHAFAARPHGATALPGVVQAHGLGGWADEKDATGLAARLGLFTLAYTGPGGGTDASNGSGGLPAGHDDGYRMFDTLTDPRGSWFWGHAVAAMRGVTCLADHPDVDASRLGMTGYSAGAVATLISAAVDDRLTAAVPLSGTGGWGEAVKSPDAWQNALLAKAGLTKASPEWTTLLAHLDSVNLLPGGSTPVMMANGTSDEFFPLTAHVATFDAIAAGKRMSLAGNFDHGCYAISGVESAEVIEARAAMRAEGAQRLWFHHHFGTDPDYAWVPEPPTVTTQPVGQGTFVTAQVDESGSSLVVERVKIWWSNDQAFLWGSLELDDQGGGVWTKAALFPTTPDTLLFVDVVYRTSGLFPERVSISSRPAIPAGFVPHIRDQATCL